MYKRFVWVLCWMCLASPVSALEGVIQINQDRALAGGVTAGDTAGFPVTINARGSYRLTSNLVAPSQSVNVIEITADGVAIDLNRFSILGGTICGVDSTPKITSCSNTGTGSGIVSSNSQITIVNGLITGLGNRGIDMGAGLGFALENLGVSHSGGHGVVLGNQGFLTDCVVGINGGAGIVAGRGAQLRRTTSGINGSTGFVGENAALVFEGTFANNLGDGINLGQTARIRDVNANDNANGIVVGNASLVRDSSVANNASAGIAFTSSISQPAGYQGNVVSGNGTNISAVPGTAIQLGTNVCGSAVCP